ncbi:MAG: radical SAM protein [Bacteroidia bacterium]|nr:radical SAM protein [Bacteroidia bacterium]
MRNFKAIGNLLNSGNSYINWYKENSHRLTCEGLWLRGDELNTLPAEEFEKRNFRVLFVRLSTYHDTSGSFAHRLLYQVAKKMEGIFPDLAYLPPGQDLKYFEANAIPWILPVKTKRHPLDYDLIGLSNSIVQEMINIPVMLKKSGIPLSKKERMNDSKIPIIILGGANAINTSLFFNNDSVIDGIFIGEDTSCIRQLIAICRNGKQNRLHKSKILKQLEDVPGFFQPDKISAYKNQGKIITRNVNHKIEQLTDAPVLYSDEAGSGILQISEGCPYFCSFCSESWNRKPYIEENAEKLIREAGIMKASMGLDNIELYSFNFNIHSDFYNLLWELSDNFSSIGLKSQRFDTIAKYPEILKFLQVAGKSGITCGLEGISQRMRKYLHKNLDDPALFKSLGYLLRSHFRELKIFLIATGKEKEEDYQEFKNLLNYINTILKGEKHRPRIIFSVTPLVRFPMTPLEFDDAFTPSHYKKVIDEISKQVTGKGFEIRSASDLNDYYISQILVRAADEKILPALIKAIEKTGFVFYRDIPDKFINEFTRQLIDSGLNPEMLIKGSSPEERSSKPWSIFHSGVDEKYLIDTFNKCVQYDECDPCFRTNTCNGCGACKDERQKKIITQSGQTRSFGFSELHQKIVAKKNNTVSINFLFETGTSVLGVPRKIAGIALARAIMMSADELAAHYCGYKNSYLDKENKGVCIYGDDILTLLWNKNGIPVLKEKTDNPEFIEKVNSILGNNWGRLHSIINEIPEKTIFTIQSKLDFNPREHLKQLHLKYTLRKISIGEFNYEFTKESLKKNIILSMRYSRSETGDHRVRIETGLKFSITDFIKKSFVKYKHPDSVFITAKFVI